MGVVLGAAAAAATIVLFLCVILAISLCVQRRRKGIVHTPACVHVHVFEVTSDRQFTIMLIHCISGYMNFDYEVCTCITLNVHVHVHNICCT